MASLAHTYLFSSNKLPLGAASELNVNFEDTKIYINDRNSGAAAWEEVDITSTSATPHTITSSAVTTSVLIDNTRADGDPQLGFQLGGISQFTMGVDDGDGDKFKIGTTAIGTGTWFTWDGSNVTLSGGLVTGANVVSDTDSTDDLGTTSVRWANLFTDSIGDSGATLAVGAATLSFDAVSTIDTSGENALTIDVGSEALNVTAGSLDLTTAGVDTTDLRIDNSRVDGDPILSFQLSGTSQFTIGVDDGDGDDFKLGTTAIGTSTMFKADSTGAINKPLQPSFLVTAPVNTQNVTGDGTGFTVEYDTEIFDQNSDFNISTYAFTAPVTGRYSLCAAVRMNGATTAISSSSLTLVTSNRNYTHSDHFTELVRRSFYSSVIADMDSGDTVSVTVIVSGGGKTVEVEDSATIAHFSGSLIN